MFRKERLATAQQSPHSPDYWRQVAYEPHPFPSWLTVNDGFEYLTKALPETPYPAGKPISIDQVKDHDLIHFPGTGAVVSPQTGNMTGVEHLHRSLSLGIDAFEPPPAGSGLSPDKPSAVVRHNRPWTNQRIFDRLVENAKRTGTPIERAEEYVRNEMPTATAWLGSAVIDALDRLNAQAHYKLLDPSGIIKPEYAKRTMLINGVGGAGVASSSHLEHKGIVYPESVIDFLDSSQTGTLANLVGAGHARTEAAACSGSGVAMEVAQTYTTREKDPIDLAIIVSAFDGPVEELVKAFNAAGMKGSTALPYLWTDERGYLESPVAVVTILLTKRLAKELGMPISQGYLVKTVVDQGKSKWGIGKDDVPNWTYDKLFELFSQYFPRGDDENKTSLYDGTVAVAMHGANTEGWFLDISYQKQNKNRLLPHATFSLSSTQPLMGHQYAPRSTLSLELLIRSSQEGILWGMAPASYDFGAIAQSIEERQDIRRWALKIAQLGKGIDPKRIVFSLKDEHDDEHLRLKALRYLKGWEDKSNMHLNFSTTRIPKRVPLFVFHQGLGGVSVGTMALPIGE